MNGFVDDNNKGFEQEKMNTEQEKISSIQR
jgi:hypothetical protein